MHECTNAPMHRAGCVSLALVHWCILALTLFCASACAHARATPLPDNPPLDMPAPPPRDVEPPDTEAPPPMPLPQEPARSAPARTRPAPPRQEPAKPPAGATPEPPKPETPPIVEPPKPEEAPKPANPLQTTPAAAEGEAERAIRATIARATTDLNRIDPSRLNAGAKTQYDAARGFLRQADAAVRAKNLVFARTVADKAAVLAAQLAPK
jgi:outer membrane biosynthesis protein TonB